MKKSLANLLRNLFLSNYPTTSRFAEAYRTLRTNVHFSFMDKSFRSLLITSAGEKEGKTSTVANFGYTLSQAGKSVLLIDGDLRKPMLSKIVDSDEIQGLTGLLTNLFGTVVTKGSLEHFGISDLVTLVSLRKGTGVLYISNGKDQVGFYFLNGNLMNIRWLNRPVEKNLINFLVKNRLLSRENAVSAVNRQKETGQNLSFVLTNMGFMNKDNLKGPLNIHTIESIRIALQMKTGVFFFKELQESEMAHRFAVDFIDIPQIYKDTVSGEERFPYLEKEIDSSMLKVSDNLFLLPSGHLPPNPSELLGSERMSFLISYLIKRFDVVVIDSPPILPASDALLLAPQTDGTVLIVKAGLMNRELVKKAVDQLRLAKANLVGIVLNDVDVKREGYYKYYHKYYSGYYGEKKSREKTKQKSDDKNTVSETKPDDSSEKTDRKLLFINKDNVGKQKIGDSHSDDENNIDAAQRNRKI